MIRRIQPHRDAAFPGSVSSALILAMRVSKDLRRTFCSVSPLIRTIPPEESDPNSIPHRLLSILTKPNWHKSPSLKQMVPSIRPSHVSSLFSLDLDPKTALNFSHWISQSPRFKHSVYSYASLLALLVNNGFKLRVECYNALLNSLARFGMVDEMEKLYVEMLEEGEVSPNVYTYNKMVFGYCKVGNVVKAKEYVSKIVEAGLEPDFFTDTSLVMGYCRSKDLDSAFKVFEEMSLKGFRRNEVAYTHLIHGLCVERRVDEAMELFARMKDDDDGDNCYPTVRTYTVLINALCGSKRKSEALVLRKEMSERGITPNIHTERKFEEARELLGDMVEKGLVPSVVTYNALINGYCEYGMMEDALDVVELMESRNVSPNTRTYNELIHGFCKKNVHKAMGVFHKMLDCRVAPSVVTYNSLIDGQCRSARELFDSLEEKGVDANVVMYTALIDGYCKSDKLEEAKLILKKMLSKSCLPNTSTFNALIHGLCTDGKLSEAMLLEKKMVEKGDFDHAEKRYCNAGRMKEAEGMMEKMKEDGVFPDSITYSSLIKGYADQGLTDSAFGVLKCMLDAGCEPSHHTFLSLIKHLVEMKHGKENDLCLTSNMIEFDIVVELLDKMAEHGVTPNARSYEILIKGICETGNLRVAEKVLERMMQQEEGISPTGNVQGSSEGWVWVFKNLIRSGYYHDEIAWKIVIDGVGKQGQVEAFNELFTVMDESGCKFSSHTYALLTEGPPDST
ncbi:BnaCnng36130D [Brassica napus]|uniref:BnaCnng36130D protein n=1 Tax=Brassica napus TaxID=3708 RepID=A0A078J8Z9_BRANA|nr:BnaCnng36130D [Brassica napus]